MPWCSHLPTQFSRFSLCHSSMWEIVHAPDSIPMERLGSVMWLFLSRHFDTWPLPRLSMHLRLPGAVPICTCCPSVIINSTPFHSHKCHGVGDELYGYPTHLCSSLLLSLNWQLTCLSHPPCNMLRWDNSHPDLLLSVPQHLGCWAESQWIC